MVNNHTDFASSCLRVNQSDFSREAANNAKDELE